MDVIASGYAGVLPNGNIVDRREFPDALPVQKNEMFNVPKPKKVEKEKYMKNKSIVSGEILAAKVVPEKFYPVSYTIKYDGTKVFEQTELQGKDLTEQQIIELHKNGKLSD